MPHTAALTATYGLQSLMVVDDSPVQRAHAVQLCREAGIPLIYEAVHGQDALDQLSMLHLKPDLMLVDLHMPVMDGVELITQLHEREWKIPMLIVSSQQQSILNAVDELSRTLGLPLMGFLSKPMVSERLSMALQHLQSSCPLSTRPTLPRHALPISSGDLCAAIEQGQLQAYYQPKVDIRSGLLKGMEVLARWKHPELGFVPPDQFIALAEKEQLIHDLTLQIFDKALAQAAVWKSHGFAPQLAINLSPLLLECPMLVSAITDCTRKHGLLPRQIVLEVTESAGVEHLGRAIAMLTRLRLHGFGLSIDDYGTGFSSMQQLARLPFTELKIDRSFVNEANRRSNLSVILESALDMARRLELVSVAEGIETLDDWRLLQRYGCNIGQGYLIGKPMPAADMPAWLRQHRQRLPQLREPLPTAH